MIVKIFFSEKVEWSAKSPVDVNHKAFVRESSAKQKPDFTSASLQSGQIWF